MACLRSPFPIKSFINSSDFGEKYGVSDMMMKYSKYLGNRWLVSMSSADCQLDCDVREVVPISSKQIYILKLINRCETIV